MRTYLLVLACALLLLGQFVLPTAAGPYLEEGEEGFDDYSENNLERLLQDPAQKRACVRRGGNCDHRPKDCCYNSSCRCNLWGANCRCQRMGLFQKWGK
ncbi:U8-agatoxin-Ao1a-like isoform X2 [Cryptotermes secundus]|uniref:U8-agatoxin-Ao1a-like isoform X2 n=1 Tax=Cryptotermes secundus TaxID=105785 RepID=UPI000CD7C8F7|nr:U8-agatoxin-Ao1a-like isoform X2 [Cryptotermes secundus]